MWTHADRCHCSSKQTYTRFAESEISSEEKTDAKFSLRNSHSIRSIIFAEVNGAHQLFYQFSICRIQKRSMLVNCKEESFQFRGKYSLSNYNIKCQVQPWCYHKLSWRRSSVQQENFSIALFFINLKNWPTAGQWTRADGGSRSPRKSNTWKVIIIAVAASVQLL